MNIAEERLDEFKRILASQTWDYYFRIPKTQAVELIELARQGLRLKEHMAVCGNFIREAKESQDAFKNEFENCKHLTERLTTLQNSLEAAKRDTEIVDGLIALVKRTQATISYSFNGYVDIQLHSGECCSSFTDLRRALESVISAERKPQTIDQYCGQPDGTFQQFVKDNPNPEESALNAAHAESVCRAIKEASINPAKERSKEQ